MTHFNCSLKPLTDLNSITTSQNHQEQAPYIPDEIIKKIFKHLEQPKDLSNCIQVCKQWSQSAKILMDDSWILDLKYRKGVYASKNYLGHSDRVYPVVLSADGTKLFSGSLDKTIKIWNVESEGCLHTLQCKTGCVRSVVLSTDGKKLFSSSGNTTVKFWDVETGVCSYTLQCDTKRSAGFKANPVVLSADWKKLFFLPWDGTVKIWDVENRLLLGILQGHDHWVNSVALSTDGTKLFSGSVDTKIKIWDVKTGDCLRILQGHKGPVNSVLLSADGTKLFSCSDDKTIKIWDVETGDCLHTLKGHTEWVDSFVLSADGKKLFSCSGDKTIKIWDVETGDCLHTLKGHTEWVNSFVLSADGKKLFSCSDDKTIKVWDVETGDCLYTLQGHTGCVKSVALSADGTKLFSGSDDTTIKIWNYGASSMEVFQEIANLFQENTEKSIEQALERFGRMPLRAKQAIYAELYSICKPFQNDYWGCAEDAFHDRCNQSSTPAQKAEAILRYLREQNAAEENPDPSKMIQVSGSVLTIDNAKELESSVKVTEITDLDTVGVETALDSSEVHDLLANLGIVTQEDYSEKLKNTPGYLAKIGLKTVEDLKTLGLGFEPINKLVVDTKSTDWFELQTQAFKNKDAIFSFVEALSKVVDKKLKEEIPNAAFLIDEKPWVDLQGDLKKFETNLTSLYKKSQNPKTMLKIFSPESCAEFAKEAKVFAKTAKALEKEYQVQMLKEYATQYGIYKLWTRLNREGIQNLSAFVQQQKSKGRKDLDLFRMGE